MTTLVDVINTLNKEGFSQYMNQEWKKCQLEIEDMEDRYKVDYAWHKAQSDVLTFLIVKGYLSFPEKGTTLYSDSVSTDCVIQGNMTMAYPKETLKN